MLVIPAQAGIQIHIQESSIRWIPAFAGMTPVWGQRRNVAP